MFLYYRKVERIEMAWAHRANGGREMAKKEYTGAPHWKIREYDQRSCEKKAFCNMTSRGMGPNGIQDQQTWRLGTARSTTGV
jgi:hypothetical protein